MTRVCPECFDDKGLKRRLVEIRPKYPNEKCDFHPRLKGIPIEPVAGIVDVVFRNNYGLGRYHNMLDDFTGESLEETLYGLTGADDENVIRALIDALIDGDTSWWPDGDDAFYKEDASYERSDRAFHSHDFMWAEFRRSIVHDQRFFNDAAKLLLSEIFDGIHRQRDTGKHYPVILIEPNSSEARLLRARIAEDSAVREEVAADPSRQMGPPPTRKRRPGRMNPSGICAFYAGYDLATCIAELRPRVGSVVASAEFEIIRPIVAFNTTRFAQEPKEPNLFAKDHIKRMAQWRFMQTFMHEIAQPISPDDEHLDYVPTQAVAEYLLRHHKFHLNGEERRIEAIIYRSAQHPAGKNIVILGDACTVEANQTKSNSMPSGFGDAFDTLLSESTTWGSTPTAPRLRLVPDSVKYHLIREAAFTPEPFHDYAGHDDI